jgi:hypothetical protein
MGGLGLELVRGEMQANQFIGGIFNRFDGDDDILPKQHPLANHQCRNAFVSWIEDDLLHTSHWAIPRLYRRTDFDFPSLNRH